MSGGKRPREDDDLDTLHRVKRLEKAEIKIHQRITSRVLTERELYIVNYIFDALPHSIRENPHVRYFGPPAPASTIYIEGIPILYISTLKTLFNNVRLMDEPIFEELLIQANNDSLVLVLSSLFTDNRKKPSPPYDTKMKEEFQTIIDQFGRIKYDTKLDRPLTDEELNIIKRFYICQAFEMNDIEQFTVKTTIQETNQITINDLTNLRASMLLRFMEVCPDVSVIKITGSGSLTLSLQR